MHYNEDFIYSFEVHIWTLPNISYLGSKIRETQRIRFSIQSQSDDDLDPDEHYVCAFMTDELPITATEIAEGTKKRYSACKSV